MTPLHQHGRTSGTKGMKQGRNPQAQAFLQRMLDLGLIRELDDDTYEITKQGREVALKFREAA